MLVKYGVLLSVQLLTYANTHTLLRICVFAGYFCCGFLLCLCIQELSMEHLRCIAGVCVLVGKPSLFAGVIMQHVCFWLGKGLTSEKGQHVCSFVEAMAGVLLGSSREKPAQP